jgi:hypothetical protein
MDQGSLVLTIALPTDAAQRLLELHQANGPQLKAAGISSVEPLTDAELFLAEVKHAVRTLISRNRNALVQEFLNDKPDFQELARRELEAFSAREARRLLDSRALDPLLAEALRGVGAGPLAIAQAISPVLIDQVTAGQFSLPLLPELFAALALRIAQQRGWHQAE